MSKPFFTLITFLSLLNSQLIFPVKVLAKTETISGGSQIKFDEVTEVLNPNPQKLSLVVFITGLCCPQCRFQLVKLNEMDPGLKKRGIRVIVISPDPLTGRPGTPPIDFKVDFEFIHDPDGRFSQYFLKPPIEKSETMAPFSAAFFLDTQGKVLFKYENPNFVDRFSGGEVFRVVRGLVG